MLIKPFPTQQCRVQENRVASNNKVWLFHYDLDLHGILYDTQINAFLLFYKTAASSDGLWLQECAATPQLVQNIVINITTTTIPFSKRIVKFHQCHGEDLGII